MNETKAAPGRKQSLFELGLAGQSLKSLLDEALTESGGEFTAEIEALSDGFLADNKLSIADKLEAYAGNITQWNNRAVMLRAEASIYKAEYDRLIALAVPEENKIEGSKKRIQNYLELIGETEVKTDKHIFRVQTNGGKAALKINEEADPMNIPIEYQSVDFDKVAIKEALESYFMALALYEKAVKNAKEGEVIEAPVFPKGLDFASLERGKQLRIL